MVYAHTQNLTQKTKETENKNPRHHLTVMHRAGSERKGFNNTRRYFFPYKSSNYNFEEDTSLCSQPTGHAQHLFYMYIQKRKQKQSTNERSVP